MKLGGRGDRMNEKKKKKMNVTNYIRIEGSEM
jgi:hypothetical protein